MKCLKKRFPLETSKVQKSWDYMFQIRNYLFRIKLFSNMLRYQRVTVLRKGVFVKFPVALGSGQVGNSEGWEEEVRGGENRSSTAITT